MGVVLSTKEVAAFEALCREEGRTAAGMLRRLIEERVARGQCPKETVSTEKTQDQLQETKKE